MKYLIPLFAFLSFSLLTTNQLAAQSDHAEASRMDTTYFQDVKFRSAGPTRGGRVTAVEGIRDEPATFYMGGAANSGLWRTENYGHTWTNLTDGKGFKSTSIGAIDVANSDHNIIYVGTGSDAIRDNVLTGTGMYKSTDAGKSWQFMGLKDAGQIGAVEVDPDNPDLVYVAALGHLFGKNKERGVYRSKDGGQTWENILFASDSTGAVDLEFNPDNSQEIYAAMWRGERKGWTFTSGGSPQDGLYKSTDGGDTWKKLTNGLPQGLVGKADFAVTPDNPDRVYALMEASGDSTGLYRSDDRGEHWKMIHDGKGIMNRPFYFTNITADPNNEDIVYAGSVGYFKSTDAGKSFDRQRGIPHGDVQDLWINPDNSDLQVQGSDGGATVTRDGGQTWSTVNNQPTAELWQVHVDNRFPYRLYAGQQDESTIMVPSLPLSGSITGPEGYWRSVGGCETGPAVPVPDQPNIVYTSCKGRFGRYNINTGQEQSYYVGAQSMYGNNPKDLIYRFQRTSPIEISPHNSDVVYYGAQYVMKTTNGGVKWTKISPDLTAFKPEYQVIPGNITRDVTGEENFSTLNAIRVSPHDDKVIWTGANDGPVHVTRDGGQTWTDVTPANLPEDATVDAIDPSPHEAGKAYIAAWRRFLDDFHPYIYRTTDYGQHWTLLTNGENGIPADYPTRVVREDPDREGLLYAGTDWGLFISFDDGGHWQRLNQGLPNTAVTDIRIHDNDLILSTFGRGFWIMDNVSPLRQLTSSVATDNYHLFKPEDTYRMQYRSRGGSGVPSYPQAGAMIDFYLPQNTKEPVTLNIVDQNGNLVHSYAGAFKAKKGEKKNDIKTPSNVPGNADDFIIKKGHNRFTWNMRYPGKTVKGDDGKTYYGARGGPLATPGTYAVRLSSGDWSSEQSFNLLMDPRVKKAGITQEDLQAQLQISTNVRDALGAAHKASAEVDSLKSQVNNEAAHASDKKDLLDQLDTLHQQLVARDDVSYPMPKLIDHLQYLYYMTLSADQQPGQDAYTRLDTLQKRLDEIVFKVGQLKAKVQKLR